MPLSYCGINLFGQFDAATPAAVSKNFKPAQTNEFFQKDHVKVSSTWCYAAFAAQNRLILQGFLGQTHRASVRHEVSADADIKEICTCDNFCLVLLENGKLYKILPKLNSLLEEIKLDKIIEPDEVRFLPQKRTIFGEIITRNESKEKEDSKITHIACGTNITVAIDAENCVFSIPSEIYRFPKRFKVRQLVCGFEHAMLLSENGDVYVWGIGLRGQLGREELAREELPVLLEALAGIKITHIAAGGWHCAAISAFGDVYVWGFNSDGQLSLGPLLTSESKTFFLPQIATLPTCLCGTGTDDTECLPVRVFSGARHIVLEMQCGTIYSSGCNKHGQLGQHDRLEEYVDNFSPMTLDDFKEKTFNIYCGHWNTIFQYTISKTVSSH